MAPYIEKMTELDEQSFSIRTQHVALTEVQVDMLKRTSSLQKK